MVPQWVLKTYYCRKLHQSEVECVERDLLLSQENGQELLFPAENKVRVPQHNFCAITQKNITLAIVILKTRQISRIVNKNKQFRVEIAKGFEHISLNRVFSNQS